GCGAPFVRRRNPQSLYESRRAGFGLEELARCGEERVYVGFIDRRIRRITFALDGPIRSIDATSHEVDTGVLDAELVVEGKLRPKPYFLEEVGIQSCGLQISLHEAFESEAFVTLGKGLPAEFIQNISKSSHL